MKILFIINSLRIGGAEKMVVELSKVLTREHSVSVLSISNETSSWQEDLKAAGVNLYNCDGRNFSIKNIWYTYRLIKREKFDVVHTHLTYAQIYGAIISRCLKKTVWVTTEHSNYNNRRKHLILRSFDRWLYAPYNRILSISQSVQDNLLAWLRPKCTDKYSICPNGINTETFRSAKPLDRSNINISVHDTVLMMVGRMADAKDSPTIMRALNDLPPAYKLILIGDGPLKEQNERYAEHIGVKDRVVFAGARNNIPQWLRIADIYIQSSHWEGMPTTVLEAMAAGIVALGSDVPGNRDLLNDRMMFEHGNEKELVKLLKSDLDALKEEQQQYIADFDLKKIGKKLISIYREQIDANPV